MKIDVVGIRLVKEREIDYDKSIHQPIDTVNFVLEEMQDLDREMCMTLNLDANNCVLNAHVVSVGGLDRVVVDVKNIMKSALLSNAHGIIMYHNHPSGNSTPSQADFLITEKIKKACEIMDIQFLDHIVIGKENYHSMIGGYTNPYDVSKRKTEKTTRVLTIQSSDLDVSKKVYADKDRCNYQKALPIYRRLFDFLEEQEVEKPKEIYYIAKEDLETQFIDGYTLGYHYEWTVQKPNYKGENFIGLLPNNRVYKNGFIYQFKTEKEAKQMIVDTYQKWKDSFDRMKADKESYPVVEYDNEPRVRGNLYLLTEPVKQLDGSKMLFSEHWYSGLNGYFYTLTLPYEDKMDLQGRILYQKDKIDNVSRYINRDLKDRHKAPIFYTYIDELIERCDYLVNELGYNDSEYMATLPDLKMLVEMYEKYEKEREIYLKDHPMVEQETDVEYEEIEEGLDEMDMEI